MHQPIKISFITICRQEQFFCQYFFFSLFKEILLVPVYWLWVALQIFAIQAASSESSGTTNFSCHTCNIIILGTITHPWSNHVCWWVDEWNKGLRDIKRKLREQDILKSNTVDSWLHISLLAIESTESLNYKFEIIKYISAQVSIS